MLILLRAQLIACSGAVEGGLLLETEPGLRGVLAAGAAATSTPTLIIGGAIQAGLVATGTADARNVAIGTLSVAGTIRATVAVAVAGVCAATAALSAEQGGAVLGTAELEAVPALQVVGLLAVRTVVHVRRPATGTEVARLAPAATAAAVGPSRTRVAGLPATTVAGLPGPTRVTALPASNRAAPAPSDTRALLEAA